MEKLAKVIEHSIEELAREFQQCAMNYVQEADLQAGLFHLLRNDPSTRIRTDGHIVDLVHAEWPRIVNKHTEGRSQKAISGAYDLVVWTRDSARHPQKYWGIGSPRRAIHMKLLAVIEIKHWRADKKSPKIHSNGDINRLKHALRTRRTKYAYHLVFIDDDEVARNEDAFNMVREELIEIIKNWKNLEVALVVRSGGGDIWL